MAAEPDGSGEADGVLPPAEPAAGFIEEEPPAAEEPGIPDEPDISEGSLMPDEPDMLEDPLMEDPEPLPATEEGLTFRSRQAASPRQSTSARMRERSTAVKRFIQKRSFFFWRRLR